MRFKQYLQVATLSLYTTFCSGQTRSLKAEEPIPMAETDPILLNRKAPPANFRVAYVGDQGSTSDSIRVLNLIKSEKANLFILAGDFDYKDDPKYWDKMMRETIGDMPVLAVIGNHDVKEWKAYAKLLTARLEKMPRADCQGEIGVKMRCNYEGMVFVLSGIGTQGEDHETFIKDSLRKKPALWKVCVWHKNQTLMQVGEKGDSTGWDAYEICRREGAMVATGHEHSYERTFLMSSFDEQKIVHQKSEMDIEPGKSFAFVSGLGGKSIRPENHPAPWWAKVYTSTQNAKPGVLFCTYNVDNKPDKAKCYFKNIDGEIIDQFEVTSKLPAE